VATAGKARETGMTDDLVASTTCTRDSQCDEGQSCVNKICSVSSEEGSRPDGLLPSCSFDDDCVKDELCVGAKQAANPKQSKKGICEKNIKHISSCTNEWENPTEGHTVTYLLDKDITKDSQFLSIGPEQTNSACFHFKDVKDMVLDCQNHKVDATIFFKSLKYTSLSDSQKAGFIFNGVFVEYSSSITIKNCEISNFDRGIESQYSEGVHVFENNKVYNNKMGIYSTSPSVYDTNIIYGNSEFGLVLGDSEGSKYMANTVCDNTVDVKCSPANGEALDSSLSGGNNIWTVTQTNEDWGSCEKSNILSNYASKCTKEFNCGDTIDGDSDGKVDCKDSDCAGSKECESELCGSCNDKCVLVSNKWTCVGCDTDSYCQLTQGSGAKCVNYKCEATNCVDNPSKADLTTKGSVSLKVGDTLKETKDDICSPDSPDQVFKYFCNGGVIDFNVKDCPDGEICTVGVCEKKKEVMCSNGYLCTDPTTPITGKVGDKLVCGTDLKSYTCESDNGIGNWKAGSSCSCNGQSGIGIKCTADSECASKKCDAGTKTCVKKEVIAGDVATASGSGSDGCVNLDDIAVISQNVDVDCKSGGSVPSTPIPGDVAGGGLNGDQPDGCVNLDDIAVISQGVDVDCVPK